MGVKSRDDEGGTVLYIAIRESHQRLEEALETPEHEHERTRDMVESHDTSKIDETELRLSAEVLQERRGVGALLVPNAHLV